MEGRGEGWGREEKKEEKEESEGEEKQLVSEGERWLVDKRKIKNVGARWCGRRGLGGNW